MAARAQAAREVDFPLAARGAMGAGRPRDAPGEGVQRAADHDRRLHSLHGSGKGSGRGDDRGRHRGDEVVWITAHRLPDESATLIGDGVVLRMRWRGRRAAAAGRCASRPSRESAAARAERPATGPASRPPAATVDPTRGAPSRRRPGSSIICCPATPRNVPLFLPYRAGPPRSRHKPASPDGRTNLVFVLRRLGAAPCGLRVERPSRDPQVALRGWSGPWQSTTVS